MAVGTRRLIHFDITSHRKATWTFQQFRSQHYRFLIHDRDSIYSEELDLAVRAMGVRILKTPFRSPQSPYPRTSVSPNWITQSLFAVLAGLQVPFPCAETHELGEELVASYLYQVHLYHWLETNDYGRFLSDQDR